MNWLSSLWPAFAGFGFGLAQVAYPYEAVRRNWPIGRWNHSGTSFPNVAAFFSLVVALVWATWSEGILAFGAVVGLGFIVAWLIVEILRVLAQLSWLPAFAASTHMLYSMVRS